MNNNKRILSLTIIGLLLVICLSIGISYSYKKPKLKIKTGTESAINTREMGLIYTGASEIDDVSIVPGSSFQKTFTVENISDNDLDFNIYIENVQNGYSDDLVYTLYETDAAGNIINTTVEETKLPVTKNGKQYLQIEIPIEARELQYYKMVVEYKVLDDRRQTYDENATFTGTVGIDLEENVTIAGKYRLRIDPNGGVYDGNNNVISILLEDGESYEVLVPQRDAYTFVRWEVSEENVYENDMVTINGKHVTLTAIWEVSVADAVARIDDVYYSSIQKAENAAKENDEIVLLKNTSEVFNNSKTVTLNLSGFKVTGQLNNTGNITIIDGTIENENDYAINNMGTLTLGINDGNVSVDSIAIISDIDHNALKQLGTFNFYDGYIQGKIAINGSVNSKPDGYVTYVDHKTDGAKNYQKAYLVDEESIRTRAVAKRIDGTEILYYNLQDAILNSVESGKTVYAIRNFQASYDLYVPSTSENDIVFDIDGYNVEFGSTFTNDKNLTIKNGKTTGTLQTSLSIINNDTLDIENIVINGTTSSNIIENDGDLEIKNSSITALSGYALNINNGNIILDDDTYLRASTYAVGTTKTSVSTLSGGNIYGIASNGNLTIQSGTIYNYGTSGSAIYLNSSTSILTFNDGNIISTGNGIYDYIGTVTMNGGTIKTTGGHGVYLEYYSTFTMNDGYIEGKSGFYLWNGNCYLNLYNGTIIGTNNYGIESNVGNVNMRGGTVIGKSYGIYKNSGNVVIYDGYVEGENYYGIYGPVTVKGGTIKGKLYGLYTTSTTAIMTIGTSDDEITTSTPVIIGGSYGVYHSAGTVKFYDGILKGKINGYYNIINEIADGAIIVDGEEEIDGETYQTDYLVASTNFLEIVRTGQRYNSFNKALADVEENDVIKVLDNGNVQSGVDVSSDKKVTIDLNNNTITFTQPITNNGDLTIIDSSNEKDNLLTTSTSENILVNRNKLTLNNVNINKSGSNYAIYNNGAQLNLNSVNVTSVSGNISCASYSTLNINNSSFNTSNGYNLNGDSNTRINFEIIDSEFTTNGDYSVEINAGNGTMTSSTIKSKQRAMLIGYGTYTINDSIIESTNNYGLYVGQNGIVEVNNTNIKGSNGVSNTGSLTINNCDITGNTYGINNDDYSKVLNINSGTIKGGKYGVYSSASTNIGVNDDEVTIESPIIMGGEYGLYVRKGTSRFYDGILKGTIDGYYGTIGVMADGTLITD